MADEADWTYRDSGPYDWRVEGPLAYWYHVERQGYGWDNAPLPPRRTLERWLEYDPHAFALYWPGWYNLVTEGQWDTLYPPEPAEEQIIGPVLGPVLRPVYGNTPSPSPSPSPSAMPEQTTNPYVSPIDGRDEMPAWLRALDAATKGVSYVAGLLTATKREQQQAAALEGDPRPQATPTAPGSGTSGTQQALYWLGLAAGAAVIWYIITRR